MRVRPGRRYGFMRKTSYNWRRDAWHPDNKDNRAMQSMHQSFLNIQRYRYALYAGLLGVGCVTSYVVDSWRERPAGNTVLGYTLGGSAGALVLFLMSYGIRRRSFHARAGATTRWLSMHVYLGMCLLLVVALHSGLQFGCNVHTLAYGLLCVVVLS